MNKKNLLIIIIVFVFLALFLQTSKLALYTLDSSTEKPVVRYTVSVFKILPTDKKLSYLASKLSKKLFGGKHIELLEIKSEDGKEIAYFDLQDGDKDINSEKNWYSDFQGSSGAKNTKDSIIETLLQKDLKGNWVDGIKLMYNSEFIELDHIAFEDKIYFRK